MYAPQAEDLYGSSVAAKTYDFGLLNQVMEGAHRKGHFQGVATVVEKLFRIFQPQRAYFGEKDFQQLQVIKQLVQQAQLDVEIVSCPIVRTAAGLALSSRNQLLTPPHKMQPWNSMLHLKQLKHCGSKPLLLLPWNTLKNGLISILKLA